MTPSSSTFMRQVIWLACLSIVGAHGVLAADDIPTLLQKADTALRARDYVHAKSAYESVAKGATDPDMACTALIGVARCQSGALQYDAAKATLTRAVATYGKTPSAAEAMLLLGLLRLKQGNEAQASQAFISTIGQWPTTPAAFQALHQLLDTRRGAPEEETAWERIKAWLASVDREGREWVSACRGYAMVYLAHDRLDQAHHLLTQIATSDPKVLDILQGPMLHKLDPWYQQQRDIHKWTNQLLRQLAGARDLAGEAPTGQRLAELWEAAGRPERALEVYGKIVELAAGTQAAIDAQGRITHLLSPLRDHVIELAEDRTTQGDWIGRYGGAHYILCAMMSPGSVTGGQGPFLSVDRRTANPNERPRSWLGAVSTDEHRALRNPFRGGRTYSSWDDHGEIHPYDDCGPDLLIDLQIPAGLHRLSLYFVDWDTGTSEKPRSHTIVLADSEGRVALQSSVSKFAEGLYKRFGVIGPLDLTVKIHKDYSNSVVVSGIFLDRWDAPALLPDPVRAALPPAQRDENLAAARATYEELRSLHDRDPVGYLQRLGECRQLVLRLQRLLTQPLGAAEGIEARWLLWRACKELPDGLIEAEDAYARLLSALAASAEARPAAGAVGAPGAGQNPVAAYEALIAALHDMGEYQYAQQAGDQEVALLVREGQTARAEQVLEALALRYLQTESVHVTSDFGPRDLAVDRELDPEYAGAKVAELADLVAARAEEPAPHLLEIARRSRDQGHARFAQLVYEQIAERYAGQLNTDDLLCWVGSAWTKEERRERADRLERAVPLAANEDDRVLLQTKLADALMELNEIEKAAQVVDLLAGTWGSDDPRCANLVYNLALTYRRTGRNDDAERRFRWVIDNHGSSVFARCSTRYLEAMGR